MHIMPPSADFIISIHAPTRGATVKIILWVSTSTFQSTLPRGERRSCCNKVTVILDFNPRSHEGSDVMWLLLAQRQNVFQSTLPRGERHIKTYFCNEMYYFNPRSHEGSDNKQHGVFRKVVISIHAPTRGATRCSYKLTNMSLISIHAPTRGATRNRHPVHG